MIFAFAYGYIVTAASITVFQLREQGLPSYRTHWLVTGSYSRPKQPPSPSIFSSHFPSVPLLPTAYYNNPSFVFMHCQTATFWPQKSFLFCCHLYLSDNCRGNFFWGTFLLCGRDTDDSHIRSLKTYCSLARWMGLLPCYKPQTDAQSG